MPITRRWSPLVLAAFVAGAALAPPAAWPQTAETFKSAGPIPYTTYLRRTGQAVVKPKAKHKPVAAKSPASPSTSPSGTSAPRLAAVPAGQAPPSPAPLSSAARPPAAAPRVAPPRLAPPQSKAPLGGASSHGTDIRSRLPEQAAIAPAPAPPGARLAPSAPLPAGELEAFVDGAVRQAMGADHVAGVAVVVVQGGQIVLQKGYGLSSLAPARPVDPQATLFRLGSVSKVLTWIEVLKQVDAGRLSLDAPIDDALPERLKLGLEGFKQPVTLRLLMTHAAGFEARELGRLFKADPSRLLGPERALREERSQRVREAGSLASYSNYGVALAGAAAAAVAKSPFDRLMEDDLLRPASLRATSFREPYPAKGGLPAPLAPDLAGRLSQGFRWTGSGLAMQAAELGQDFAPALSASATPQDVGRLMEMMLGGPAPWSPRVTAALLTPLPSPTAGVPGWTYGLQQQALPGGFSGFGQGGATLWFRSRLLLAPQLRLGVFVTSNTDTGHALADRLPGAVVARFYGPALPLAVEGAPAPAIDAQRYAGLYLTTRRAYHGLEGMVNRLTRGERVSVGADGQLAVSERSGVRIFRPDGPDRFTSADGGQTLVFLSDPRHAQAPARLLVDGARTEGAVREDWLHEPAVLGGAALLTAFTALLGLAGLGMRQGRDYRQTRAQALAAGVQTVAALAWLFAIGATGLFLHGARDPAVSMYHWPNPWLVAASWAALVGALLGLVQLVQLRDVLGESRRRDTWSTGRRLRHILSVVVFVGFSVVVALWGGLEPWSS